MGDLISDARVRVLTAKGDILELGPELRQVVVSDGLGIEGAPRGSLLLPLKRTTSGGSRVPYWNLIQEGDLVTVDLFAWDGARGGWYTVLHGPITDLAENEALSGDGYEVGLSVNVASMAHIPSQDTVAYWMWLGSVEGWARVMADIAPDEGSDRPGLLAFRYMQKVAFHRAMYSFNGLGLSDLIHLDFGGLKAIGVFYNSFTMVEGPHLQNIAAILDPPFQEIIITTEPPNFTGDFTQRAARPPGVNGAATLIRWRSAPYPYLDKNGKPRLDEWNRLPLHTLDTPLEPIRGAQRSKSDSRIRNFFLAYPALSFVDDTLAYALGTAIANRNSIAQFGYRPLKPRTHLIATSGQDRRTVEEFMIELAYRVAGQHNRLNRMYYGQVQAPLYPWIRPGHRLRAPYIWDVDRLAEYHVYARQMTWTPTQGGSMQMVLERGLPVSVYQAPAWFAEGLEVVRSGSEVYASAFKR